MIGTIVILIASAAAFLTFGQLREYKVDGKPVESYFWLSIAAFFIVTSIAFSDLSNLPSGLFVMGIISAFIIQWWRYQRPKETPAVNPATDYTAFRKELETVSEPFDAREAKAYLEREFRDLQHPTKAGALEVGLLAVSRPYFYPYEEKTWLNAQDALEHLRAYKRERQEQPMQVAKEYVKAYRDYMQNVSIPSGHFKSGVPITSSSLDAKTQEFLARGKAPLELSSKITESVQWSVDIPEELRFEHTWLLGPPGSGKTQTIQHLITRDLQKRASIFVMDSQGDLVRNVSTIASIQDRLLLIEPETVSVNPFDLRGDAAIGLLTYVFGALGEGAEFTPRQQMLYHFGIRLMQEIPNATLLTFVDLLTNGLDPYAQYVEKLATPAQLFFRDDFRSKGLQDTKEGVGWRLKLLLSDPTFERMFTRPTNVDLKQALDQGKVVVVDTSKEKLGGERSSLFGRFMIAYLLYSSQQRASQSAADRMPVYAYIDEAQEYLQDDSVATILDQARKMRVAMLLANQRSAQVKNPNMLDALLSTSIKIIRTDTDASLSKLAKVMHCEPEAITELTKTKQVFAFYARGWNAPFPALIPFGTMEALEHVREPRRTLTRTEPVPVPVAAAMDPEPVEDPAKASSEL